MNKQTSFLGKALGGALLVFAIQTTQAQTVENGGFEDGPTLCANGNNGPFSLSDNWVSFWAGANTSPLADPSDAPGFVYDQTATCPGGQYTAGSGPEAGNRSIRLVQKKKFGTFPIDGSVTGAFSQPLMADKYDLCIMMRGNGWYGASSFAPVVQIYAAGSGIADMLLGEFTVTNTTGWNIYSSVFTATAAGYNNLKIKLKQQSPVNYDMYVDVDEVKIGLMKYGGTMCHYGTTSSKRSGFIPATEGLMQASPNPATDVLHIDLANELDLTNTVLTIVDLQGKAIRTIKNPSANRLELDVADLMPGMYFIKLQSGVTTTSLKFIKQ